MRGLSGSRSFGDETDRRRVPSLPRQRERGRTRSEYSVAIQCISGLMGAWLDDGYGFTPLRLSTFAGAMSSRP